MRDWPAVKDLVAVTINSLAAQKDGPWKAIVVANEGADLPAMPEHMQVVWVDFPANPLPPEIRGSQEFYDAVRLDKGSRILHGLVRGHADGHVMLVDYDDLVSNRLAELVASSPSSNGWFFDSGYIYSGGTDLYRYDELFYKLCGTSHIIRADLLKIPSRVEDADTAYIRRWLGSHVFIKDELDEQATPLAPLPLTGAIYRIGHPDATSGSPTLAQVFEDRSRRDPDAGQLLLKNMVKMTQEMAVEFFGCNRTEK